MRFFSLLLLFPFTGIISLFAQDQALFDEIRLTETLADYGLTGKGTIIAVFDRGIDYRHPDFIREDGTTRILYILDLSDDTGINDGDNPVGKGTVYTAAEINQALQSNTLLPTRDASGHGTPTAGIAAGNGRGSEGRFLGIAPEADLIIVKITSEGAPAHGDQPAEAPFSEIDRYLDDAIDFVWAKAQEEGKPVSMIANFGSIQGPMDGTSTLSRAIDSRFGPDFPGKVFTCGSSDDGGVLNRAEGLFIQEEEIELIIDKLTTNLRLDLWHHEADSVQIFINAPSREYGPYTSPSNASSVYDSTRHFKLFYQGSEVDFFGSTSPRKELLIDFFDEIGSYILRITGIKVEEGRFDAIINPSNLISDETTGNRFVTFFEPGGTIWDLASSRNNICPNSYILRKEWRSIAGGPFTFIGDENGIGSLWTGSGIGPTQDGRIGIDVSVPGNVNFGAYAPDSYFATFTTNVVEDDEAMYGTLAAVSGANPVLAGVIALMLEADSSLTATDVKSILQQTARVDSFTGAVPNNEWGYGKLDVYAAISQILGPVSRKGPLSDSPYQVNVYPNPTRELLTIQAHQKPKQDVLFQLTDIQGRVLKMGVISPNKDQLAFSLKDLSPGIYLLSMEDSNGIFYQKISKF